tara:strand:+ start:393 stop:653 length:261 start_codon:yes stop_codon:yes gene_type:complete
MKFNITIDCTPEEAREFLGMPDVKEAQAMMLKALQENIGNMDADSIMKYWMPFMSGGSDISEQMMQGMKSWQDLMMGAMKDASKEK